MGVLTCNGKVIMGNRVFRDMMRFQEAVGSNGGFSISPDGSLHLKNSDYGPPSGFVGPKWEKGEAIFALGPCYESPCAGDKGPYLYANFKCPDHGAHAIVHDGLSKGTAAVENV
jgi:hypothetical protein